MDIRRQRVYKKPPVVEVIAELVFEGSDAKPPWSQEVAADFLKAVLPEQNRQELLVQQRTEVTTQGVVSFGKQALLRVRAFNKSSTRAVQVGNNYIACHLLRTTEPYDFKYLVEHVSQVLPTYEKSFAPGRLTQAGLWYVDIVRIPGSQIELNEYLRIGMQLPDTVQPANLNEFDCRAVLSLNSQTQRRLDLRVRSISETSSCSFRIDWHLTEALSVPVTISEWLNAADVELYRWFDCCLTPKCLDLFEVIEER